MQWMSIPKAERKPKTQTLFAKLHDVDERTLSDWKRINGFSEEVAKLARFLLKDAITDIYAALAKRAIEGDVPAIKLAMEMMQEYTPRQEISGTLAVTWSDFVEGTLSNDNNTGGDPFA